MTKRTILISVCLGVGAFGVMRESDGGALRRMSQRISDGHTIAWARHITGQDVNDLTTSDDFNSVAVIPGGTGVRYEDEVWVVTQRTIDGNDYRYIEQFTPLDWGDDPNYCWFVDAGGTGMGYQPGAVIPEVLGNYPTLRATTDQADPGLTHTTPIANKTDLQNINTNLAGNYYLTNNIDATGAAFTPLGNGLTTWFTGTFDGSGYTIDGLNMDSTGGFKGLFGSITGPAKIANVTLTNCNITGRHYTGALVGQAFATATDEPLIQNCHSSGSIKCKNTQSNYNMGGLIGGAEGILASNKYVYIYDCSSSCTVDENAALVTTDYGGFIGKASYAIIQNSSATGQVIGATDTDGVGGFVGGISVGTIIRYCHATGIVNGESGVGGFVGYNNNNVGVGLIEKCYSTGNVTNTGGVSLAGIGGFVGKNGNGGNIQNCYARGSASSTVANVEVGGFAGEDLTSSNVFLNCYSIGAATGLSGPGGFIGEIGGGAVTNCFWDTQASGNATSDAGVGHITTWLKTKPNYPATWDFDTIWYMDYTAGSSVPEAWIDGPGTQLDGASVCVYADAMPRGTFTMDGNDIVDFNEADYSVIIAGLNYYSIYESFPIVGGTQYGPTQTQKAQITDVRLDFYETLGANIGVSIDESSEIVFSEDDFATQLDPWTGPKVVSFPRGTSREPIIYIWEWQPIPLCLRGAYVNANIFFEGD